LPFCPGCGKQTSDAPFCPYCGRSQAQPVRPAGPDVPPSLTGPVAPLNAARETGKADLPYRGVLWCSLGGALAMAASAAAAFLPWLDSSGVRITGTERDGWLTFALALAGAVLCLLSAVLRTRWPFLPALICATALVAIAGFDIFDIVRTPGLPASGVGAGLWLTASAGVVAVVACSAGLALAPGSSQE
jgi:hypothetical protein